MRGFSAPDIVGIALAEVVYGLVDRYNEYEGGELCKPAYPEFTVQGTNLEVRINEELLLTLPCGTAQSAQEIWEVVQMEVHKSVEQ